MKPKASQRDIQKTLERMNRILSAPAFDIEKNLQLIINSKDEEDFFFSTKYTLADLEYDADDVVEILKILKVEDFSHTLLDKGNLDPPYMLVFSKFIQFKEVYIKIKVRDLKESLLYIYIVGICLINKGENVTKNLRHYSWKYARSHCLVFSFFFLQNTSCPLLRLTWRMIFPEFP